MTFLTLPPLSNTFAIFGAGFKVNSLAMISWLAHCSILYWGDLDTHGFQILSQLRTIFPHVVSVMMDEATLATFKEFWVTSTPSSLPYPLHLTQEEKTLFTYVTQENIRLEQERISYGYAVERIRESL